jgi:GntR family transcriptional regulator/MocR family aminotransferase
VLDLAFRPDFASRRPVYRQLAEHLAELIATGRLRPGERVPPSRELAAALGLSRNTVSRALESLGGLGLLEGHVGRGTFVLRGAARLRLAVPAADTDQRPFAWQSLLSARARALRPPAGLRSPEAEPPRIDFRPGRVDPEALPIAELQGAWQRAIGRALRAHANEVDPLGHAPLRASIARTLAGRGVACQADDVLVTSGAQQALDLVARALVEPGDAVALEQPGWFGAALAFRAAGADLLGVGVDAEGLRVDELARGMRARRPKLVYCTPAVQLPTGVALSPARREALLELADREQVPLLEDDYDSELRHGGAAPPALKTLDRSDQVVYVGTFSKALFPGLRIGYVLAAPALRGRLAGLRAAACLQPSLLDQLALEELLATDTIERHVRRVRKRLAQRARAMVEALAATLPEGARFRAPVGGSAVWVELPADVDASALCAAAAGRGIAVGAGESFRIDGAGPPALLLSFAATPPEAIRAGVEELAALLERRRPARRARGGRR